MASESEVDIPSLTSLGGVILTLTALSGELPVTLVSRLSNREAYTEKVIKSLKGKSSFTHIAVMVCADFDLPHLPNAPCLNSGLTSLTEFSPVSLRQMHLDTRSMTVCGFTVWPRC